MEVIKKNENQSFFLGQLQTNLVLKKTKQNKITTAILKLFLIRLFHTENNFQNDCTQL